MTFWTWLDGTLSSLEAAFVDILEVMLSDGLHSKVSNNLGDRKNVRTYI